MPFDLPPLCRAPPLRRTMVAAVAASGNARRAALALVTTIATTLAILGAAGPAAAQKPPPLGAPDPASRGRAQEAGLPGKPPPSGAPDREEQERPPSTRDGMPGARERASSSGTGFVVADGRVLTNNHVINECGRVVVRNAAGARLAARVTALDRRRDLALLTVPASVGPALAFRDAPPVRRGEDVVTYGFPLSGLLSSDPTLTTGNISALAGLRDNQANFAISAPVQPGNSGGPLLDSQGNIIGVVVSQLNPARIAEITGGDIPQNVNCAVKGTEALAFLRANGVQPRVASSTGTDKRAFEIGEVANPSTVYIQCFR